MSQNIKISKTLPPINDIQLPTRIAVKWKSGGARECGVHLAVKNDCHYPQVSAIRKTFPSDKIDIGNYLVQIGDAFDTSEHSISDVLKMLTHVKRPVILHFSTTAENFPPPSPTREQLDYSAATYTEWRAEN